ncbi:MAG: ABC transporter permease [Bacteroidales bacterium]|nr:ABC transporter permease [Bacteroidales bacterium]
MKKNSSQIPLTNINDSKSRSLEDTKSTNEGWTTIIKPKEKLLQVDLKELWSYRDLGSLFIRRNITTQYKQTILGPLWYIIQPVITVAMYMVVFGRIAGISTDGLPEPLFYLSGVCLWQYFNDCLTKTSSTFVANAGIFGKVYFPRLIVPISNVISNLLRFGIQFALFLVVYAIYQLFIIPGQIHTNWYALLAPVLVLMLAGLALGFGVLFSSFTTKYRDLQLMLDYFIRLWMYATPVVWPLSTITNPKLHLAMSLNPLTPIIEAFKYGFLGAGEFSWGGLLYSFIFMVVLLAVGIVLFNRVQRTFMDTV